MPVRASRRRIEIDAEVYDMLEREARWLHIPVTSLATLMIRESVGKRFAGLTVEMDPLERDHSPAAIAELRAPVRHPGDGHG